MSTKTPKLGLKLPAAGDTNWTDQLNSDLAIIDDVLGSIARPQVAETAGEIPGTTATTTPNLGLTVPDVGDTTSAWAKQLNIDLGIIDNLAPLASPALTGSPTAPTQATGDNSTRLATTAYVSAQIAASTLPAIGEVPSGILNGTNKVFNLSQAPSPASSLLLFLNGIEQQPGSDYTLSGATITYGVAPRSSDWHLASYGRIGGGTGGTREYRFNVLDYGAVGDATNSTGTDSTQAIQNCINDAANLLGSSNYANCGVVYFPPANGAYLARGTLTIPYTGAYQGWLTLLFDNLLYCRQIVPSVNNYFLGRGGTATGSRGGSMVRAPYSAIQQYAGCADVPLIQLPSNTVPAGLSYTAMQVHFDGLSIVSNDGNLTPCIQYTSTINLGASPPIWDGGPVNVTFRDCTILGSGSGPYQVDISGGGFNVEFLHSQLSNLRVSAGTIVRDCFVHTITLWNNNQPQGGNTIIENCFCEGLNNQNMITVDTTLGVMGNIIIRNCSLADQTGSCYVFGSKGSTRLVDVQIDDCLQPLVDPNSPPASLDLIVSGSYANDIFIRPMTCVRRAVVSNRNGIYGPRYNGMPDTALTVFANKNNVGYDPPTQVYVSMRFNNFDIDQSADPGYAVAPPANPYGYLELSLNGEACMVPFYRKLGAGPPSQPNLMTGVPYAVPPWIDDGTPNGAVVTPNAVLAPDSTMTGIQMGLGSGWLRPSTITADSVPARGRTFQLSVWAKAYSAGSNFQIGWSATADATRTFGSHILYSATLSMTWQQFTYQYDALDVTDTTIKTMFPGFAIQGATQFYIWGLTLKDVTVGTPP